RVLPFVGTRQPTLQSARLGPDGLDTNRALPPYIDELLDDGDGTVPRLSAIPIEFSEAYYDTFVAERHGGLQRNPGCLDDVLTRIEQMQVVGLGDIRDAGIAPESAHAPALSIDVDDVYLPGDG